MDSRLRALCDLSVSDARELAGRHEYDGIVQDLSPGGVATGLAALGGESYADPYDEALTAAKEAEARVVYGELELHRRFPLRHVENLDLACYDRDYAPEDERAEARRKHLAGWPDGIDGAIASLDRVPAPVARAALVAARGLGAGLDADAGPVEKAASAAHVRFVAHLEEIAANGDPDVSLGPAALARLLSVSEAIPVDLAEMSARADVERDRLQALVTEQCALIAPGQPVAEVIAGLLRDHPDPAGVIAEAQAITDEVIAWTAEHRLVPYTDGVCLVGPAPESRQWATAMMSWNAPGERPTASWYHVTPPRPEWSEQEQEEWLEMFSRTTLPAITVHEVAPGHFSHGLALRQAPTMARRTLQSMAFAEGWAHYVEEVAIEQGFRADDPRYAIGVGIEALLRVTRLACAIGLHNGELTVEDAAARFTADAYLAGPAALSEARRGTFDPTYGRYTWGKLVIRDLRDAAREKWGAEFSLPRFHARMLALGSPPLGLLDHAL